MQSIRCTILVPARGQRLMYRPGGLRLRRLTELATRTQRSTAPPEDAGSGFDRARSRRKQWLWT
ncbi:MAG: hypothetical protein DRI39_02370 [Chloroflexi bacterium]|nr:MAG: hypothetical protein DRI39_02370 [Chloroflexota bacterium]